MSTPKAEDREYSPDWAPHVRGTYPARRMDPETGGWAEVKVRLSCSRCGDEHQVACSSGMPRTHVAAYARVHLHRDELSPVERRRPA